MGFQEKGDPRGIMEIFCSRHPAYPALSKLMNNRPKRKDRKCATPRSFSTEARRSWLNPAQMQICVQYVSAYFPPSVPQKLSVRIVPNFAKSYLHTWTDNDGVDGRLDVPIIFRVFSNLLIFGILP